LGEIESFLLSLPELPLKHRSEDKTVMKKVNWSIEQHIYDRETEFLAQLQKQGYIYQKPNISIFTQKQLINISPLMIVFYSWEP